MITPQELSEYLEVLKGSGVRRLRLGDVELEFASAAPSKDAVQTVADLLSDTDKDEDWLYAATEGYPEGSPRSDS